MASNSTTFDLPPLPTYTLKPLPPLISFISDVHLALALPIIAYWSVSLFFHIIDTYDLFPQYRLHTPAELLKRNHASRFDVLRDVILQHIIQTVTGILLAYIDPDPTFGKEEYDVAVWAQRIRIFQRAIPVMFGALGVNSGDLGKKLGGSSSMLAGALAGGNYPQLNQAITFGGEVVLAPAFATWEIQVAKFIYWIAIPTLQFIAAITILDSWQYFLHRGMHMNHYLYSKLFFLALPPPSLTTDRSEIPLPPPPPLRSLRLRRPVQPPPRRFRARHIGRRHRLSANRPNHPAIHVLLHLQHDQNR
jgi:sphinganine C4-monooxygenase